MTPDQAERLKKQLRLLLHSLISNAYPVVTQRRKGFPLRSQVMILLAPSHSEYIDHQSRQSGYTEFVTQIWDQLGHDPNLGRVEALRACLKRHGYPVWVGIWIQMPEVVYSKKDQRILERLMSNR